MEFDQWIKYAEDNNLLITEEEFLKLCKAKPYKVVQIDYVRFLAIEYGNQYDIKLDRTYDPMILYHRFIDDFIPTNVDDLTKSPVLKNCCEAKLEKVQFYGAILVPFNSNDYYEIGLYKTNEGQSWLSSGSGDGYTRWMLLSNLSKMPNVYIKRPIDDNWQLF